MPLLVEGCVVSPDVFSDQWLSESLFERFPKLADYSREFIRGCQSGCRRITCTMTDRVLYVGQSELATVSPFANPMGIQFVGSDDATTCHIVVLRHSLSGVVSVAHLDGTATFAALCHMVSNIDSGCRRLNKVDLSVGTSTLQQAMTELHLDLFLFGGFLDDRNLSEDLLRGILLACTKVDATLELKLACCCALNTASDGQHNRPIIYGIAVGVQSGSIYSAQHLYKGPDQVLRRARITGHSAQIVLEIFDVEAGRVRLGPFCYSPPAHAELLLALPDDLYLKYNSTSPFCEPDRFVAESKEALQFIIDNPSSARFFCQGPRVYVMDKSGAWLQDDSYS